MKTALKNNPLKHSKGFTLIEALIVVVIVAVLAALAVPSYKDFVEKNRVKEATEAALGVILQAKAQTSSRDQDIWLDVSEGEDWCLGYITKDISANCDCNTAFTQATGCRVQQGLDGSPPLPYFVSTSLDNSDMPGVVMETGSFVTSGGVTSFSVTNSFTGTSIDHLRKTHLARNLRLRSASSDWETYIRLSSYRVRSCILDNGNGVTGYPQCL